MILATHGIVGSQITQFVGLLDTYSGAAAAYSLRKLRSAYTGSAIRVRRASDNTEQDIGFVNNVLDTSTLTSFCSGTNGFVKTWYDQSGNARNATQTTAANQPQIVSSGSVILENSKPSVQFDGTDDRLTTSSISQYANQLQLSLIAVSRYNTTTANMTFGADNNGMTNGFADDALFYETNVIKIINRSSNGSPQTTSISSNINQQYLQFASILSSTSQELSINGNNTTTTGLSIATPTSNNSISLGTRGDGFSRLNGKIQEVILYLSNQSSNRTGIETNINAQYNIYWDGSQTSLLDTYSGSAAAYSLRALSSAYTGPLVRVRRASDNAEQDIYAKYDGTLNVDALENFCASTNGFVKTWYDQSGNGRDASQTTASTQPQIVSSGSVILENGKPSVQFTNSSFQVLTYNGLVYNTNTVFATSVFTSNSSPTFSVILSQNSGGTGRSTILGLDNSTPLKSSYFFNNGTSYFNLSSGTINNNTQTLMTNYSFSNNYYNALNGSSGNNDITGQSFTPISGSGTGIGAQPNGFNFFNGEIQEIVVWNSDQSSNKTGIESNINTYYSIY